MVSPLGVTAKQSWSALLGSRSGLRKLKSEHTFEGGNSRVAAYIHEEDFNSLLQDSKHSYIQKNSKQLPRATQYAMLATHEALEDANLLNFEGELDQKLRPVCGVAIGQGMVDFEDIFQNSQLIKETRNGFRKMSPYFMTRALINMSAGNISIRYKMQGPNHCVSTACATGAHSIGDAMDFIKNRRANLMVCGSTEASINNIALAGFERLRALNTKSNDDPERASRPFDLNRAGFVMGEGAGVLVLEELEHAKARGIKDEQIYCEILGYGLSSDAHHLTAPLPDGDGAKRCMRAALDDAQLDICDISHINAHATSTPLGDDIECNAIEDLFYNGDRREELTVTSCKGSIGHLLGGAGSVETIFAVLSCRNAVQPPSLNLNQPLATPRNLLQFVNLQPRQWNSNRRVLLKNSFGFGGTNASLILSNYVQS